MKNTLIHDGVTQLLLANVNDGTNRLFINDVEIPSSRWVGSGTYTQTINGVTISITKVADINGNIMLQKTSNTAYKLVRKEVIVTPPFSGATANTDGTQGDVPKPLAGQQNATLFGDGTWKTLLYDAITSLKSTVSSLNSTVSSHTSSISSLNTKCNNLSGVTLWSGTAGSYATSTQNVSVTLNQSYKNFKVLRFYTRINFNDAAGSRRFIREVSTQQINEIRAQSDGGFTIGMSWGWNANYDYVDILITSTDTRLQLAMRRSQVYKIEGIA